MLSWMKCVRLSTDYRVVVVNMVEDLDEFNNRIIKYCPSCDSTDVSVRVAKYKWYFVGCRECWNKLECDEANLERALEIWNRRADRRLNR